jgi:hypothetical protein
LLRSAEKALAERTQARDALAVELAEAGDDFNELSRIGAALAVADEALSDAEEEWFRIAIELESRN